MANFNSRSGLTVEVRDNYFEGNTCTDYGGAIDTGALQGTILIVQNAFFDNFAEICAGAIYQFGPNGTVMIESNLFVANRSPLGATLGIEHSNGTRIRGNTIVASQEGEGIRVHTNSDLQAERNLVAFGGGVGIYWDDSRGRLSCNNSFGNAGDDYQTPPTTDNFSLDPLFCDVPAHDYTLRGGSPCLPEGNACAVLIGAFAQGCEPTSVSAESWALIKSRYRDELNGVADSPSARAGVVRGDPPGPRLGARRDGRG